MLNPIVQLAFGLIVVVLATLFGRSIVRLDEFLQLAGFVKEWLVFALEYDRDLLFSEGESLRA